MLWNLPPFTQQQKAPVECVYFPVTCMWFEHFMALCHVNSIPCGTWRLERSRQMARFKNHYCLWGVTLIPCTFWLCVCLLSTCFFFLIFAKAKAIICRICLALWAPCTAVALVNDLSTCVLCSIRNRKLSLTVRTIEMMLFFLSFLNYKVKIVLFVSSGPKPCEACRQEEIYEEPISILNSNEVSPPSFQLTLLLDETSSSPPLCLKGKRMSVSFP